VQALMMMNEAQYFEAARYFAQRLLADLDQRDEERLRAAYEAVTSHLPDAGELADLRIGLDNFRSIYRDDPPAALALTSDLKQASDAQRMELAAYTMVINSLFNLDVAKTRE
jgi:hypothetical protein